MLLLALALLLQDGDLVVLGKEPTGSWIWAAEGVKIRRSGAGAYDGFPLEDDPSRPGEKVARIEVSEAAGKGVFHGGLFLRPDSMPVDVRRFAALEFWIRGGTGGEDFEIGLADVRPGEKPDHVVAAVKVSKVGKVTTDWTKVRIPIKDLAEGSKINLEKINQVEILSLPGQTKLRVSLASIKLTEK